MQAGKAEHPSVDEKILELESKLRTTRRKAVLLSLFGLRFYAPAIFSR